MSTYLLLNVPSTQKTRGVRFGLRHGTAVATASGNFASDGDTRHSSNSGFEQRAGPVYQRFLFAVGACKLQVPVGEIESRFE